MKAEENQQNLSDEISQKIDIAKKLQEKFGLNLNLQVREKLVLKHINEALLNQNRLQINQNAPRKEYQLQQKMIKCLQDILNYQSKSAQPIQSLISYLNEENPHAQSVDISLKQLARMIEFQASNNRNAQFMKDNNDQQQDTIVINYEIKRQQTQSQIETKKTEQLLDYLEKVIWRYYILVKVINLATEDQIELRPRSEMFNEIIPDKNKLKNNVSLTYEFLLKSLFMTFTGFQSLMHQSRLYKDLKEVISVRNLVTELLNTIQQSLQMGNKAEGQRQISSNDYSKMNKNIENYKNDIQHQIQRIQLDDDSDEQSQLSDNQFSNFQNKLLQCKSLTITLKFEIVVKNKMIDSDQGYEKRLDRFSSISNFNGYQDLSSPSPDKINKQLNQDKANRKQTYAQTSQNDQLDINKMGRQKSRIPSMPRQKTKNLDQIVEQAEPEENQDNIGNDRNKILAKLSIEVGKFDNNENQQVLSKDTQAQTRIQVAPFHQPLKLSVTDHDQDDIFDIDERI
ncbi:UNKNOWN [Stylonychia lemnae]|uniref:Uncharacterized protein n=1 Tax=Stylonychia lemnae TaxID=5949 RepID=A0A077ZPQ4_STYLE|nr:UNKNOWN [Stylonychia lemnae]|eukprot:CDW71878.1 UNKNOWN [Stylonychia lemnae]